MLNTPSEAPPTDAGRVLKVWPEGSRAAFQEWMVSHWTSFFTADLTDEQREHHRWWRARSDNMQKVKNFTGYFSKSLGKDEGATGGLPGRWWGSFNKAGLPVAAQAEAKLEEAEAVRIHRLARKRRQKQMDQGKHAGGSAKLKKFGSLNVTPVQLWRLRSGYDLQGYRNPEVSRFLLACHEYVSTSVGIRPGKARFRGKVPNTGPIVLCGPQVRTFVEKAVVFTNGAVGAAVEFKAVPKRQVFTPDPLKPVPPGRTPRNPEEPRFQSDFFDDLPITATPVASPGKIPQKIPLAFSPTISNSPVLSQFRYHED